MEFQEIINPVCPKPSGANKAAWLTALKKAAPCSSPVLAGYAFLGFAYGMYATMSGLSAWYPFIMSVVVYGASLEMVAVTLLLSTFAPAQALILAILIQARHLFYGIAMLDRFKGAGWKKFYMIFAMTDETFAVNYSTEVPEGVDKSWHMFWVTVFDHCYWITASTMGGVFGSMLNFDAKGLDFVLTAMFVTIFFDRLLKEKRPYVGLIGLGIACLCAALLGPKSFLLASMGLIWLVLTVFRKPLERSLTR